MKLTNTNKRGMTYVLVVIVMMVTSIWLASLSGLTSAGLRNESRRITLNETLASADASLELAWSRWRSKTAYSSTLPTETELTTGWTDAQKRYVGLNGGVTVDPTKVKLRQMDPLGRIMEPNKLAGQNVRTDVSRGLIKRSVSYVATVTAEGQPLGSSSNKVSMTVNRVFQKSDIPLFQYLAFFDHTLFLHPGPAMVIGGRLHSNKRIYFQPGATVKVRADMSGPAYSPQVYDGNGVKRPHATIKQEIKNMIAGQNGKTVDDVRGFFYGEMLDSAITGITNSTADSNTVLENGSRYNPSGQLSLFDPNDSEFKTYWRDNNSNGKIDWTESSNSNVNSGYRELIEKPKVRNSNNDFYAGEEDTLFIASKRFYNQANIKIELNTNSSGFLKSDGTIDPNKVNIYYKDLTKVPKTLSPNASAAEKLTAMKGHMAKEEVPSDLKDEIMKALSYDPDAFTDAWIKQENAKLPLTSGETMDGQMDIVEIDVAKLKLALDAWTAGTIGKVSNKNVAPLAEDGVILYISDGAANPTTAAGKQKGIRLKEGKKVPNGGFTMATDMLAYVQGDFNTGGVGTEVETNGDPTSPDPGTRKNYNPSDSYRPDDYPSAILADNIRLLSSNWDDSKSSNISSTLRLAKATTYNMAMVMGDKFVDVGEVDTGGLHNFPRFLESWKVSASGNDIKATIFGAFIQLWQSKYIRYKYDNHTDMYSPPLRQWSFAQAYLFKSPPGTLDAVEYTRGQYWLSLAP